MKLKTIELKFLLKLLGRPGYRGSLIGKPGEKLKPNGGTKKSQLEDICKSLEREGLVGFCQDVTSFSLTSPGQGIQKLDPQTAELSEREWTALKRCKKARMTPGQLKGVPAQERQEVIASLARRDFLKITSTEIKEVWLTSQGDAFLRNDLSVSGSSLISLNLLGNYLNFLQQPAVIKSSATSQPAALPLSQSEEMGSGELLEAIARLDAQYNTANYLPLFYLRDSLSLSRQALDKMLYDLQGQDEIELDTLQEMQDYSEQQLRAGIPQPVGGPLFFVSLPE